MSYNFRSKRDFLTKILRRRKVRTEGDTIDLNNKELCEREVFDLRGEPQVYRGTTFNSLVLHIVRTGLHECASVDLYRKQD